MSTTEATTCDEQFWAAIRRDQFLLDPNIIFLQGGSVGPSPLPVVDRVTGAIRAFDSDPLKHQGLYGPLVEEARTKLAAFTGTTPERIALVMNTTMGMSVPAQGLTFQAGGEILMTDQEYGAVNACWNYIAERNHMTVKRVELPLQIESKDQLIKMFKEGLTHKTRVMVFSHVYWSTGLATPLRELVALGREYGVWVIVDGAHAVGMAPLALDEAHPHFYISSCHKWLLSAKGTGMLYVSKDAQNHVEPLILGGSVWPSERASRFDMMGTRDQTPFLGLGAAIDFQNRIGWEKIRAYCMDLARYLKERIMRIKGGRILTPIDPELSGFITTFSIEGADIHKIRQELWNDENIETTSFGLHDIQVFRISTHFYTNYREIDRFVDAIEKRL